MSSSTRVPAADGAADTGTDFHFSTPIRAVMAAVRVAIGFTFLWAFLDKMFGLGYSTPSARAWVNGGSPTKGFLSNVSVGPFQDFFHSIAGATWADWGFMLGLLGLGVALIIGAGMKIAAVTGPILLGMMWLAEWPMATVDAAGKATGSTNPFVDDHVINALVIILLALLGAGKYYGIGGWWSKVIGSKTWLQ